MKWNPVISPAELEASHALFPKLKNRLYAKLLGKLLERAGNFLGYPVGIVLPFDIAQYEGNEEALRALRLLAKFRSEGFVDSFYQSKHPYGDEPNGEVTLANLTQIKRFGFSGKGADMFDRASTLWPAVGEAVERYAMQFFQPKEGEYVDASWNELKGPKADIFDIAGFDDALRSKEHHLFNLSYDADSKFRWIKTTELPSRRELWAPLQWFSFSYIQQRLNKQEGAGEREPLLSIPITTGVAAGQNETDATLRGLLEVIERDAFIIYWLNRMSAKKIDPRSFKEERFDKLQEVADRYRLEIHLLYLQTDVPVHTICPVIVDRSGIGPAFIVGAKTGFSLSDTAYGALSDTLAHRGQYRMLMNSDRCKEWKEGFDGDLAKVGHQERMYYWFDKERLKEAEAFLAGDIIGADTLPAYGQYTGGKEADLSELLTFFEKKGYQVFARELLNEKLKQLTEGLSVVMVRVPKMQPVYLDESLISTGGDRLREVPELLGHDSKKDGGFYTSVPHPFP